MNPVPAAPATGFVKGLKNLVPGYAHQSLKNLVPEGNQVHVFAGSRATPAAPATGFVKA
jgi:hypothetical protein